MTENETYVFTTAKLAMFLAFAAFIGFGTQRFVRRRSNAMTLTSIVATALGLMGIVFCVWISRARHPFNGFNVGQCVIWFAIIPVAIGFGYLQASLPLLLKASSCSQKRLEQMTLAAYAGAALIAADLWPHQERTAFTIPCVLTLAALVICALSPIFKKKPQKEQVNS